MFPYDDHDYESLLNDPAIDPDSADALYALAQFCRRGKGCPASEVAYQKYLQRAADAGSVQAKTELDAVTAAKKPMLDKVDISAMSLGELVAAADDGKADALVPAARRALKLGDTQRAVRYLKRALDFMSTGAYVYTDEEAQDICMTLAHIMQGDPYNDEKAVTHYYGMAQEFGSVQAARLLERRYRTGTGVAQDDAQADAYALIAAHSGNAADKLNCAAAMMEHSKNVDAALLLEEAAESAPSGDVAKAISLLEVQLGQREATPELVCWAWSRVVVIESSGECTFGMRINGAATETTQRICIKILFEKIYNCRNNGPDAATGAGLTMKFAYASYIVRYLGSGDAAVFPWAVYCVKNATPVDKEKNKKAYADALYICGDCCRYGKGTKKDDGQADAYYVAAAEAGNKEASVICRNVLKASSPATPSSQPSEEEKARWKAKRNMDDSLEIYHKVQRIYRKYLCLPLLYLIVYYAYLKPTYTRTTIFTFIGAIALVIGSIALMIGGIMQCGMSCTLPEVITEERRQKGSTEVKNPEGMPFARLLKWLPTIETFAGLSILMINCGTFHF